METHNSTINRMSIIALLLALPTAYFILISVSKYNLGIDGPFDSAWPFLESMGIKEGFGWNINLLIVFGPPVAVLLCIFQIVDIRLHFTKEEFQFHLTVQKKWLPLLVVTFSAGLLATLFFYMLGENCNC